MSSVETYYSPEERRRLLELIPAALSRGVRGEPSPEFAPEEFSFRLCEARAVFVTLRKADRLRGCMGSLTAEQPLYMNVLTNAWSAAFRDPRFPAVRVDELELIRGSISVLSPLTLVPFEGEGDLLSRLRPGVDGLLLRGDGQSGTFLPAVWEQLPDPGEFLRKLKAKAGVKDLHGVRAFRYTTESFS